jgi:hypothetical protein
MEFIVSISYNILLYLPCREVDLDCAVERVGFNSDQLASSTFANDYTDFMRTLDYTSSDSTLTCWVHQQPSTTTGLREDRMTICWPLHRLLVSPTKLVGVDFD